jgi:hypothetical protein
MWTSTPFWRGGSVIWRNAASTLGFAETKSLGPSVHLAIVLALPKIGEKTLHAWRELAKIRTLIGQDLAAI